jgi:hypothetical protein
MMAWLNLAKQVPKEFKWGALGEHWKEEKGQAA